MRKVLRFFEIIIVGLLLTAYVLLKFTVDMVSDKDTVKEGLNNSGIYEVVTDEFRKEIHKELDDEFSKYPELNVDLDEMIDKTLDEKILKDETNYIIDSLYSDSDKVELDPNILIDGYRKNLNEYLEKENIELPKEINDSIDELLSNQEIEKIDISDYTKEYKETIGEYKSVIDILKTVTYSIGISALVIMGIAIVLSKEKLKVVYKPLLFSSALLIIGRISLEMLKIEANDEFAKKIIDSGKNLLFKYCDRYIFVFLVVGTALLVTRILQGKKETA